MRGRENLRAGEVMTEEKIKTRKFRIIGWREPKRLDKMNVPELMMVRDRAYSADCYYRRRACRLDDGCSG